MDEQMIKEQICEMGRRMYQRNMVAANDGNISVKIREGEYFCTPTGVSKGYMTPDYICRVDAAGNLLEANPGFRPSSEMKMHMRVYARRPDIGAVVHAHPPYATSFAVMGAPLDQPIISEAVVSLGTVPVAEYGTPSTDELPEALEKYLPDYDAVLLEHHGALTYAADLTTAYMRMESVEFYAQLLYQTRMLGGPRLLSRERVKKLIEVRKKMGIVFGKH